MPHILIVEDSPKVANVLDKLLKAHQYETHIIDDGNEVLPWLKLNETDLVLLDVMLPGMTGLELCPLIRKTSLVPIIMLTALREEEDQLRGLELGVNDYITKPFSINNVLARIKTNIRFSQQLAQQAPVSKDGFLLDKNAMEMSIHGESIELTHAEFRILFALRKAHGKILSRQQLIDEIYDDNRIVSDRTIDTHVKSLRKKLAKQDDFDYVQSVYGKGYKFTSYVSG